MEWDFKKGMAVLGDDRLISRRLAKLGVSKIDLVEHVLFNLSPNAINEEFELLYDEMKGFNDDERKSIAGILKRLLDLAPRVALVKCFCMNRAITDYGDGDIEKYQRLIKHFEESKNDIRSILSDLRNKPKKLSRRIAQRKILIWDIFKFLNSNTPKRKWKYHSNLIARILSHFGLEYTPSNVLRDLYMMRAFPRYTSPR